ncbi:MAG TPA: class A beta-lactamase [Rhodopila sp.]
MLRRNLLVQALLVAPAVLAHRAKAAGSEDQEIRRRLARIEHGVGGRLGVSILDPVAGKRVDYRGNERFPLCSTYKLLAGAAVLARVDRGEDSLERRIVYPRDKLVTYSPATEQHAGAEGMTLGAICEAAVRLSDNTAGNLLLESLGGPSGLTSVLRAWGDSMTRLDRIEPQLNDATPGDPRDTTTPAAMAETVRKVVVADGLSATSRERLAGWLIANRTGDKRLRAGLPGAWRAGDRTGAGDHATTNDVAVIWPPGRAPLIAVAYLTQSPAPVDARNAALAQVGQIAAVL